MTSSPHPAIMAGDIIRHPATQRVGAVVSTGYLLSEVRWADGSMFSVPMSELIPASWEEQLDFEDALLFRAPGNIVRLADGSRGLVLHAERGELYVLGLYAGANLVDPILGRDYWIDWVTFTEVIASKKFEAAARAVVGKLFKTGVSE